jgi:hypothetical protein
VRRECRENAGNGCAVVSSRFRPITVNGNRSGPTSEGYEGIRRESERMRAIDSEIPAGDFTSFHAPVAAIHAARLPHPSCADTHRPPRVELLRVVRKADGQPQESILTDWRLSRPVCYGRAYPTQFEGIQPIAGAATSLAAAGSYPSAPMFTALWEAVRVGWDGGEYAECYQGRFS